MKHRGIFCLTLLLCVALSACGKLPDGTPGAAVSGAEEYRGSPYSVVLAELQQAGFTDIETEQLEDLNSASQAEDGLVSGISINGRTDFADGTEFPLDAKIVITYHTIRKVYAPLSSDEIKTMDIVEVRQRFVEVGFTNIETVEVYDLDPDTFQGEFENTASIDTVMSFSAADAFAYDSKVTLTCHRPYEKYNVVLKVECVPNFLFNRYDIDISLDDAPQATLKHGESGTYEFRLKVGEHTFTFASAEDAAVKYGKTLNVYCDMEAAYRVNCENGEIAVTEVYVDREEVLSDTQVKIQFSRSDLVAANYQEVEKQLADCGFTNIRTVPVYDIVFGITDSGETSEVTIGGRDDYKRGDIFERDAEVVITYHMPEKEAPADGSEPPSPAESGSGSSAPPEDTAPLSYSTNSLEQAKQGNSGVFSYRMSAQGQDLYCVIDFEEGYVYCFTDGEGADSACEKLKIESGDLNSGVAITYRDGESEWHNELRFKRPNQPDTLLFGDGEQTEYEFAAADLAKALELRDTKEISGG